MNQQGFNKRFELVHKNDLQIISQNDLYFYNKENDNVMNKKEDANSLRHRSDWDINKGDFVIEPPKLKRKIFRKQDLRNFISGFWYIILSLLITYLIMNLLTKIN
jgi:hypothetical protein